VSFTTALAEEPDDLLGEIDVRDLQPTDPGQPSSRVPQRPQQRLVPNVDQVIAGTGLQHLAEVVDLDDVDVVLGDDRRTQGRHRVAADVPCSVSQPNSCLRPR
jgi:hypothetical protein